MTTKTEKKIEPANRNVGVRESIANRARDVVFYTPGLSLSDLVEDALVREIARREKINGGPFASRGRRKLKPGRRPS